MNRRVASWRFICATLPPSTAKVSVQLNPHHVEEYPGIWPQVLRIAGAHLVSPALWSGLSRMNLDGRLPESARQYLQSVHGMNAVRNVALLQQLDESILALNNLGVVPLLIKGASYLKSYIFEDPAARITSDLDMVVMEQGLPTALDALQRVGYNPVPRPGMDFTRHRHCAPMFRNGDYACIELHRELVSEKLTAVLPLNEAWNASTEVCEDGLRYRTPSPTHTLILSFLHNQIIDRRDETYAIGLRSIQDLLALDAAFGASIDWEGIQSRLQAHGLHKRFQNYLFAATRATGFQASCRMHFGLQEQLYYGIAQARIRWRRVENALAH